MSSRNQKKKLSTALKTLEKALKDSELTDAFELIESAISKLPEDEPADTEKAEGELPRPDIAIGDVAIYSDGACRGNPGPGSWAFVVQDASGQVLQTASGVSESTTNNKMELQGAIEGLVYLEDSPESYNQVHFHTDSRYVSDGITKWVPGWKARGWKKADKKTPENVELWKRLDELNNRFHVKWIWVKGHAGHPQNELCDRLANEALDVQGF